MPQQEAATMLLTLAVLTPLAGWFGLDARLLGEATLIGVAAITFGYVVFRFWPRRFNPQLFGTLAALALPAGLAYAGSTAAAVALGILFLVAILFAAAALLLG
jgi:hypothetical protein